ncbi:hypothetical protein L249_2727 [Ophiocordyceps polyrhachis-furcata BCC 54312]|uniref:VHS domain-containing protein n=1 Tax=Ophiocordyceps polyrhachis-furcata BCC 54312 TaxID=1330021 RepID=A0A367LRP2_9HYPO|nr:hypothetical protein L249_2727 [Ophiocordyceps polyrhachis-furcata BCC 54312]
MFSQKKPYSAITVTVENLTSESYSVDDFSGIPDLVEVIKLQATGPTEAARAIRKKLKYGNVHRQLRALVILDGLIQNAGSNFQRTFADEPLLERLRVCGTSGLSDPAVRKKATELFREWSQYAATPGLERVARLYKELPKRKVTVTQDRSKAVKETENPFGDDEEREAEHGSEAPKAGPSASTQPLDFDKTKKKKKKEKHHRFGSSRKSFSIEAEKETMKSIIAEASIETTNLMNSLQSINRERQRISENRVAVQHFEACKQLRRRILRYIHLVDSEQWLGSLLHANDELVHALMSFEQLDRSVDADSDSDDELAEQAHLYRMHTGSHKSSSSYGGHTAPPPRALDLAGLTLNPPAKKPAAPSIPRPSDSTTGLRRPRVDQLKASEQEEDDDDPFSDNNVVGTPPFEREQPRW